MKEKLLYIKKESENVVYNNGNKKEIKEKMTDIKNG